ncbi:MAG: ParB/RepB/Spo0J family partition protein [Candidatus Bathyarchaeia archaeon]
MSRVSYSDFVCVGCAKTEQEIEECRIYQYRFKVYGRRCPRQGPKPPKVMAEDVAGDQYLELPLEIIYWKDPIRKDILEKDVNDLAMSFTCHGQIEPIVVTGPDEEGKYEGICGRMRYEAMKRLRGRPILARVRKFESEREKREWQLAENLHRRELTEIQRDEAIKELYELERERFPDAEEKHIVSTLAKRIEDLTGEKPAERSVRKRLQIASELPKEVKNAVTGDRHFGLRHAEQLLRLKDFPEKQLELARECVEKAMTVQALKKRVDDFLNPPPPKPESIDTGMVFTCPVCGETYTTIHLEEGKHKLQRIEVMETER